MHEHKRSGPAGAHRAEDGAVQERERRETLERQLCVEQKNRGDY